MTRQTLHSVGPLGVVTRVGNIVSKPHTSGEEDLPAGSLPQTTGGDVFAIPGSEIHLDTPPCVLQGAAATKKNNSHEDRQSHSDIRSATGNADTIEHAQIDAEPDESRPADRLPDQTHSGVRSKALHAIGTYSPRLGINLAENILVVELLCPACPREWAGEGVAEVNHDPDEDDSKIDHDHRADHHGCKTDTAHSTIHVVVGSDRAATVGLANRDLEH